MWIIIAIAAFGLVVATLVGVFRKTDTRLPIEKKRESLAKALEGTTPPNGYMGNTYGKDLRPSGLNQTQ